MSIKKIASLLLVICLLIPVQILAEGEITLNSVSYKRYNALGGEYVTVYSLKPGSMYCVLNIKNSGTEKNVFIINAIYTPDENAIADISVVKKVILPGTKDYESKAINVSELASDGTFKTFVLPENKNSFKFLETFTGSDASKLSTETEEALKRLDLLIGQNVLQWAINLYDPETGGFYATTSSRDYEPFTPYGESTYFVTDILKEGGMFSADGTPQWWKDKVGKWIQSHQSAEDGYFYEEMFGPYTGGARKNRDLQYSTWLLNRVGYKPLYKTPEERMEGASLQGSSSTPEYLQSEEKFKAYLASLDWSSSGIWNTGNELSSAASLIKAAGLWEVANEYIAKKQNTETGLWGEGLTYMNTNGAMKLANFFDRNHPYPHLDKMIKSSIKIQQESEPPESATYIYNIVEAMGRAMETYPSLPWETEEYVLAKVPVLINTTVDNAKRLQAPDGGFTSSYGEAGSVGAGGRIGYGLFEGDVDGTRLMSTLLRVSFERILGRSLGHSYFKEYEEWFWDEISKKEPIVKKTLPCVDFETEETFSNLHGTTGRGNYSVVSDPENPQGNKCLKFNKSVSNDISVNLPVPGGSNYKKMTFTIDIMVESMTNPNFFGMRLGIESEDSIWQLSSGNNWTIKSGGEEISENLSFGQWHKFKIEYTPKGLKDSVLKFYIDGVPVKTSNNIYLGSSGNNTQVSHVISNLRVYSWKESPGLGVFYIDNINAEYEY